VRSRLLSPVLIILGIASGLVGNYSNSTPSTSKLLPPSFAFAIWGVIYFTGLFLAVQLLRGKVQPEGVGVILISIGYFLSGLWIRVDGHPVAVAVIAVATLASNISAIYFLNKTQFESTFLNLISTFPGWITIATALVIADAFKVSTSSDAIVAIYLGASLAVAFVLYKRFAPIYGYLGTITWATFSLTFSKSSLGTPGFLVSLTAFALSIVLLIAKWQRRNSLKSNF